MCPSANTRQRPQEVGRLRETAVRLGLPGLREQREGASLDLDAVQGVKTGGQKHDSDSQTAEQLEIQPQFHDGNTLVDRGDRKPAGRSDGPAPG